MAFIQIADKMTFTDNGALSNAYVDKEYNSRVSFFFHVVRGISDDRFFSILEKSYLENKTDTWVLLFHLRDARGGKGERELFRKGLRYLNSLSFFPNDMVRMYDCVETFGRLDDLVSVFGNDNTMLLEINRRLVADTNNMNMGRNVSLLAKWLPSENGKMDKNYGFVTAFCNVTGMSRRAYRKKLAALREYLNVVECLISAGKWTSVEYNKVPSCAMNKLKKAFERHDADGFAKYISSVKGGDATMNVSQLYPYQLICQPWTNVVQVQWDSFLAKHGQSAGSWIPVCDVSGSMMNGSPRMIDICVSLGLFLALSNRGMYANRILTFSKHPRWHIIDPEDSLQEQQRKLLQSDWGMNTDLYQLFALVLQIAIKGNLTNKEIPNIIIFSDMQFDSALSDIETNLESIRRLFSERGYLQLPKIVFWNLSGKCVDFPATSDDRGVALVSGFSQSLFQSFVKTGSFSPVTIVKDILDSDRYEKVRTAGFDSQEW
jgi:hypothetical protein